MALFPLFPANSAFPRGRSEVTQHLAPYATRDELDRQTRTELEALLGRKILGPARSIGYDLPVIGVSPDVPEGPVYTRTPHGTWAYGTDYRSDPAAQQYGGVSPVPASILDSLAEMRSVGVKPTDLWIVHEADGRWEPGTPLPPTVPPSRRVRRHDELLIALTEQTKRGLVVAGAVLGAVVAAPVALVASPAIGLDPMILAGVRHPDGPCAWVPLASWNWE
jgi:hypothetical protein